VTYNGDPLGCGGGATHQSGVHPLAATGDWRKPATPAYITIPADRWTRNSAIIVTFDVQGAPSSPPTAWFDHVTLGAVDGEVGVMFSNGFEG
jgi:hypothetical protein